MNNASASDYRRMWHVSDLARVADHLRGHGVPELIILRALLKEDSFVFDDAMRKLDASSTTSDSIRSVVGGIKLIREVLELFKSYSSGSGNIGSRVRRGLAVLTLLDAVVDEYSRLVSYVEHGRELFGTDSEGLPLTYDYVYDGPLSSRKPSTRERKRDQRGRFYYD